MLSSVSSLNLWSEQSYRIETVLREHVLSDPAPPPPHSPIPPPPLHHQLSLGTPDRRNPVCTEEAVQEFSMRGTFGETQDIHRFRVQKSDVFDDSDTKSLFQAPWKEFCKILTIIRQDQRLGASDREPPSCSTHQNISPSVNIKQVTPNEQPPPRVVSPLPVLFLRGK